MYQELLQSKKRTFCSLLLSQSSNEDLLERVNPDWVSWLRNYYTSPNSIQIRDIPFFNSETTFKNLFLNIKLKKSLIGFSNLNLHKFNKTNQEPQFKIPIQDSDIFFQYDTSSKVATLQLPRRIMNRLKPISVGLQLFGVKREEEYFFYYYLSNREYLLKKDLSNVSVRYEELKKLIKSLGLKTLESYYGNYFIEALGYNVGDGFFDIKLFKE